MAEFFPTLFHMGSGILTVVIGIALIMGPLGKIFAGWHNQRTRQMEVLLSRLDEILDELRSLQK
jgi:hypothetical protein